MRVYHSSEGEGRKRRCITLVRRGVKVRVYHSSEGEGEKERVYHSSEGEGRK